MTDAFIDGERLNLFIVGACDPNDGVVMTSEDGLRRWVANVDYENVQIVAGLYSLYLGSKAPNANGRRLYVAVMGMTITNCWQKLSSLLGNLDQKL
jgi:hypothetical protein